MIHSRPKMKYSSFVLMVFMLLSLILGNACKCKNGQAETLDHKVEIPADSASFQQDLSSILRTYVPSLPVIRDEKTLYESWQETAKEIYKQRAYRAIWVSHQVLSPKGKEIMHLLGSAEYLGLNKDLYQYEHLRKLEDSCEKMLPMVDFSLMKDLEVGLTRSFLQIALHVDHGMFSDTVTGINSNFWTTREKYVQLIGKAMTDSVSSTIAALEPANPIYKRFMAALRDFVSKNNISSNAISIRNPKTDSIGAVGDARKALVYHHYLEDSLMQNDSAYLVALKRFQKENNLNGDGVIGGNTIKALVRDNAAKFQLLAINADRWRREHILTLPEKYVWVNLPSFKVKIIENDTVRLEKNVVIGKSNMKNETPILESAINQIVLWPTWTVPQSIVKKEMKSFKGYVVTRNGNYTSVVQPPGPKNALGCVKILFPNKYSVYMHDTPSKGLFNADFRAASHGCVRCQDALEIAAYLMGKDTFGITYDSLKVLKESKVETKTFRLKKSVPVFFRYFTAEADFYGNLKFYADVYGRDKDMINFIFNGKQPHVLTDAEKREKALADSMTAVKKRKADSLMAEAKLKMEQEKLMTPNVNAYLLNSDTTSARHDSL